MPQLLAIAEYITKTLAICMVCGEPANHTQRLVSPQRSRAGRATWSSTGRDAGTAFDRLLSSAKDV